MSNTSATVPAAPKHTLPSVTSPRLHLPVGLAALLFRLCCCSPLSADDLYQREIRPLLAQNVRPATECSSRPADSGWTSAAGFIRAANPDPL
ncbi:MAG UNVERIFIED_CONTAM: hypothetical protein LVR18_12910 [Planctomycetaceae bacterium]